MSERAPKMAFYLPGEQCTVFNYSDDTLTVNDYNNRNKSGFRGVLCDRVNDLIPSFDLNDC